MAKGKGKGKNTNPPAKNEKPGTDFVYKDVGKANPQAHDEGVFYVNEKTGQCAFIDPVIKQEVASSLKILGIEVKKQKALTLKGWIDLNPRGSEHAGDFSKCKPWSVVNGHLKMKPKPKA